MKIIIIGNICSGKTTISKMLAKQFKVEHVELDEYRRKHNRLRTIDGENKAKRLFIDRANGHQKSIVEITGSGKTFDMIKRSAELTICLEASNATIKKRVRERLESKKYRMPPFPKEWGADFNGTKEAMYRFIDFCNEALLDCSRDMTLNTDELTISEVCDEIVKEIKKKGLRGKAKKRT